MSDADDETHPSIRVCADGPILLRGKHTVEDADGRVHHTSRAVSALCRCGRSAIAPWCDGTHKLLGDRG